MANACVQPDKWLISIHAPREGSDDRRRPDAGGDPISIHAPREGSDPRRMMMEMTSEISIHAPREGSDRSAPDMAAPAQYFNPRSPRGERQQMCTNIHLQACKTSIKFNLAPQKPSNHTALILRKKGAVLVRSSQVMYGH